MTILWDTLREFRQVNESDIKACRRGEKHGVLYYFIVRGSKKRNQKVRPERFFCVQFKETPVVHIAPEVFAETRRLFGE